MTTTASRSNTNPDGERKKKTPTRTSVLTLVCASAIALTAFVLTSGISNETSAQPPRQPVSGASVLLEPKDTIILLLDTAGSVPAQRWGV
jgi:hypothetical protein